MNTETPARRGVTKHGGGAGNPIEPAVNIRPVQTGGQAFGGIVQQTAAYKKTTEGAFTMMIQRCGRIYELTPQELQDAYLEQQANYDREDVTSELDYIFDPDSLNDMDDDEIAMAGEGELRNRLDDIASLYREYLNGSDPLTDLMWDLRRYAIRKISERILKERG